jgi:hypothetical protein
MCLRKTRVKIINKRKKTETADEFIQGYPAVTAHLVPESPGYDNSRGSNQVVSKTFDCDMYTEIHRDFSIQQQTLKD